ncbi:MAG: hypothetical protein JOZ81_24310 [Chloroflexi bacterium]|nr:hypothetical protein [Chloroflexota bacterium]MBV9596940.1 hypothetical protein [Chloroflexota bacterium]
MHVQELLAQAHDLMTIKRVFGEPIEKNGITIIPVASVLGGFGGSGGSASAANTSFGGGLGLSATPAGVYVIKGETVTWHPAINLNRVILGGQVVAIVLLLTVRSMIRARAVRRRGTGAPVKSPGNPGQFRAGPAGDAAHQIVIEGPSYRAKRAPKHRITDNGLQYRRDQNQARQQRIWAGVTHQADHPWASRISAQAASCGVREKLTGLGASGEVRRSSMMEVTELAAWHGHRCSFVRWSRARWSSWRICGSHADKRCGSGRTFCWPRWCTRPCTRSR